MAAWTVWVDGWQHECCGEYFSVGSEVSWTLGLTDVDAADPTLATDATFEVYSLAPSDGAETPHTSSGPLLRAGGLVAQWSGDGAPPPTGAQRMQRLLVEAHHDGLSPQLPLTRGFVRSIAVATRQYFEASPRDFVRLPGRPATLQHVREAPDGFRGLTQVPPFVSEDGLVVALEVSAG